MTALSPSSPAAPLAADTSRRDSNGLRAVLAILDSWQLSASQASTLLGAKERTYYHWRKQVSGGGQLSAPLPRDTLERLSYLLGIWKALHILLPDEAAAGAWVRRANTAPGFGGNTALARMLAGNVADLAFVRNYLDGQRGH